VSWELAPIQFFVFVPLQVGYSTSIPCYVHSSKTPYICISARLWPLVSALEQIQRIPYFGDRSNLSNLTAGRELMYSLLSDRRLGNIRREYGDVC